MPAPDLAMRQSLGRINPRGKDYYLGYRAPLLAIARGSGRKPELIGDSLRFVMMTANWIPLGLPTRFAAFCPRQTCQSGRSHRGLHLVDSLSNRKSRFQLEDIPYGKACSTKVFTC